MNKIELLDLVSNYDSDFFVNLTSSNWLTLTNKWDEEIVKAILRRIATCDGSNDETIIYRQTLILSSINDAYNEYVKFCWQHGGDAGVWNGTELKLQVRAGKFLHPTSVLADCSQAEIEILSKFTDEHTDFSNICPIEIVLKEAVEQYNNYKSSNLIPSDIWHFTNQIKKRLEEQTGSSYWRQTPAYQVLAVIFILLKTQESSTTTDDSFANMIEKIICNRGNFKCTKEMLDSAIQQINQTKREYMSKEVMTQTINQDATNDLPDLQTFIVRLIEVANEEPDRPRRDTIYLFLTDVLEPYRDSMPKEIFTALQKIKKGKPIDTEKLRIQIENAAFNIRSVNKLVMEENIDNEVNGVAANGTGIVVNKK